MLENLDVIAWNDLTHAYGKAGDVPAQIRALLSNDSEKRNSAFNELFTKSGTKGRSTKRRSMLSRS
jgi:hypothetical protein